jgi:type III secretory pathway component EscU
MNELDKAMYYIFVLSLILVVVAYYAGSTKVLTALGTQVGSLIMTSTGRTASGQFAAYPQNAPTS